MTPGRIHVLYEGKPGVRVSTAAVTIEGVDLEEDPHGLVTAAVLATERGAERVELCGGVGAAAATEVIEAVGGSTPVGLNRYAFESLTLIAAYASAYSAGSPVGAQVFVVPASTMVEPAVHDDVEIAVVATPRDAEDLGSRLAEAGTGLVELYAGLDARYAAAVLRGARGALPVGFVDAVSALRG